MMSKLISAVGVVLILMSVSVGIFPEWFLTLADWDSQGGLYIAAAMRVVIGLILIVAAPASRYPTGLRIFGVVVLLAGIVIVFIPLDLWVGLIGWLTVDNFAFFRIGGGVGGALLGMFLVHAAQREGVAA